MNSSELDEITFQLLHGHLYIYMYVIRTWQCKYKNEDYKPNKCCCIAYCRDKISSEKLGWNTTQTENEPNTSSCYCLQQLDSNSQKS